MRTTPSHPEDDPAQLKEERAKRFQQQARAENFPSRDEAYRLLAKQQADIAASLAATNKEDED